MAWMQNGSVSTVYSEVENLQIFAPSYCCHNRFFFDNVFEELLL
jgi:hypothetical protein